MLKSALVETTQRHGRMIPHLPMPTTLAPTPTAPPLFAVKVQNVEGYGETLADPRAVRLLIALMNQYAVNGGASAHWGGPSAFVEIMASVHAIMFRSSDPPWHTKYNFVNDAGHCENGVYALRTLYGFDGLSFESLRRFRCATSKLTGHGEAHVNPEGVFISNGPLGSAIGQAQGLALADKLLQNKRVTICTISDGASMEGEAKEAFASLPGFARKGRLNPFLLIISYNDTKLSGRISEDTFTMEETFRSLDILGWECIWEEDGNNLHNIHPVIDNALSRLQRDTTPRPIALVFKTTKGFGSKMTSEAPDGGHGYPLKANDVRLREFVQELWGGDLPDPFSGWVDELSRSKNHKTSHTIDTEKIQVGISKALIRAKNEGLPIFSLSSDLQNSTGTGSFHKKFPDSYLDCGVAESNMISSAIGMGKLGFIPIVDTFSQFAITKGSLPFLMNVLSESRLIGLFSHTGFQDAADGASHQATTYIAATASIPYTTIVVCSCSKEAEEYLYQAIEMLANKKRKGANILFFYGRENHRPFYRDDLSYRWGCPQILAEGSDGVAVTCGPLVAKALKARELLKLEGKDITVVNHPFVNKVDIPFFRDILIDNKNMLVTVEDHQVIGGMGSLLVTELAKHSIHPKLKVLGIKGKIGRSAYIADHLYSIHDLNEESIRKAFHNLFVGGNH